MLDVRCLAFDPGTTLTGFANVASVGGRLTVLEAGHKHLLSDCPEDQQWLVAHVHEVINEDGFIAVEQILKTYLHGPGKSAPDEQLFETKDMEGGIVWLSRYLGAEVTRIPATSWRSDLGINPPRSDPQVAIVVEWLYGVSIRDRFPDAIARGHAYDALGLAAVAIARRLKIKIVLPAMVAKAVWECREEAKAAGRRKKQAMALVPLVVATLARTSAEKVPPSLAQLANGCQRLPGDETVLWALQATARAHGPMRDRARLTLAALGLTSQDPNKRIPSHGQRTRRSEAAQRGAETKRTRA